MNAVSCSAPHEGDLALEALESARKRLADPAGADDEHALVGERVVAIVHEFPGGHRAGHVVDAAQSRQDEADGEFGRARVMHARGIAQRHTRGQVREGVLVSGRRELAHLELGQSPHHLESPLPRHVGRHIEASPGRRLCWLAIPDDHVVTPDIVGDLARQDDHAPTPPHLASGASPRSRPARGPRIVEVCELCRPSQPARSPHSSSWRAHPGHPCRDRHRRLPPRSRPE